MRADWVLIRPDRYRNTNALCPLRDADWSKSGLFGDQHMTAAAPAKETQRSRPEMVE
jgi:hypothetical protein